MAREQEIVAIILADSVISPIAGTRVYARSDTGPNGLTYETTSAVWSVGGDILTSILVSAREEVNDLQIDIRDVEAMQSSLQVVEIWGYEERDYNDLDIIFRRLRKILPLKILVGSFELEWVLTTGRLRDEGALKGASMVRQDWSIASVQ